MGLDTDAASFATGQAAVDGLKWGLGKLVAGAEAMVHKFVEMVEGQAEAGKEIEETAVAVGMSTDELQRWRKAAAQSGVDAETFSAGQNRLIMSMGAASKGAKEQAAVFAKMGIKVKDSEGHLRDTGDVMLDMTDHFSKMADGTDKVRLAQEIFGRNLGGRFIPLLNESRVALQARMDAAVVMSEEEIKAGKDLVISWTKLANTGKNMLKEAISPLLPEINKIVKQITGWVNANKPLLRQWLKSGFGIILTVLKGVGVALRAVIGTVKFFVDNWKALAIVIASVAAMWILTNTALVVSFIATAAAAVWTAATTAAAWLVAAAPFIALGGILAGLLLIFDDFRVYKAGGKSLYGTFKKEIDTWLEPHDKDVWWLKAIKAMAEAIKELMEGTLWQKFMDDLQMINSLLFQGRVKAGEGPKPKSAAGERYRVQMAEFQKLPEDERNRPGSFEEFMRVHGEAPGAPRTTTGWGGASAAGIAAGMSLAPSVPLTAPLSSQRGATTVDNHSTTQIVVNSPSADPKAVADEVMSRVEARDAAQLEAANAAMSGG